MRSWTKPTPDEVARALAMLGHAEHYRHFFTKLNNPLWLQPLADKRVFSHPPAANVDERGRTRFPGWPASQYLARMAHEPGFEEVALKIADGIPITNNAAVHEDLVDVATALPPALSAKLARKAGEWLEGAFLLQVPQKVASLAVHLARGSQPDAALKVAAALLVLKPDPLSKDKIPFHPKPRALVDAHEYGELLDTICIPLADAACLKAVDMLVRLLARAIKLSMTREKKDPHDASYVWRPDLKARTLGQSRDPRDALVTALLAVSMHVTANGSVDARQVLAAIDRGGTQVFQRIALHLLMVHKATMQSEIIMRLTDPALFDVYGIAKEYQLLQRECFGLLQLAEQQEVLRRIAAGPDLDRYLASQESRHGTRPTVEEAQEFKEHWQRDKLTPLAEHLQGEPKALLEALQGKHGPGRSLEGYYPRVEVSSRSPESPKRLEDLRALADDELLAFLKHWEPAMEYLAPNREGLGRVLRQLVGERPERFVAVLAEYATPEVDPTFIRATIEGFADVAKTGKSLDWRAILGLCTWVLGQPRTIPGRSGRFMEQDADWGWTRSSILDLVGVGLSEGSHSIPIGLRGKIWGIIEALAEDPDPTPEREEDVEGKRGEPYTLGINSVRGRAIQVVQRYAEWVRRCAGIKEGRNDLSDMPEVARLLEEHLDARHDPSTAVRAILGQALPLWMYFGLDWAKDMVSRVFPADNDKLWTAAWDAYISLSRPYDTVMDCLRDQYRLAVEKLDRVPVSVELDEPVRHLAEHLMVFYWRGSLELEDPLLGLFWSRASDALRAHAVGFVGRVLCQPDTVLTPEAESRLESLWRHRRVTAQSAGTGHRLELAMFGWWFASKRFDGTWALQELEQILEITGAVEGESDVIEALNEQKETSPVKVAMCIAAIVKTKLKEGDVIWWLDDVRGILSSVMAKNAVARAVSVEIVNLLGRHGYSSVGDLVR